MTMELWTAATPNGWKVSIMIEELIEAGVNLGEVSVRNINLAKGEQFTEEFLAHNANAKIPVLLDGERSVMESCAILQYLAEKFLHRCYPKVRRAGTFCLGCTGRLPMLAPYSGTSSAIPATWTALHKTPRHTH
jgi:GST-like protein